MAALEVLTNKDLVGCIYDAGFWRSAELHESVVSEWLLECVRELVAGTKVSRVFREACLVFLGYAWGGYERQMRDFDKDGAECLAAKTGPTFGLKARALSHKHGGWAEILYGFDRTLVRGNERPPEPVWTVTNEIARVLRAVRPTTYDDMLFMMNGTCACCGDRCTHAGSETLYAEGLHPYAGTIFISHYDITCGCPVYAMKGLCIPHTWSGHLAPVAFVRNEDGRFLMQLRIGCASMTPGERDVHHFVVGARHEPWYQTRIGRLFELRPTRIWSSGPPCMHHRGWGRHPRWTEFGASIFLLAPRIPNNADWSVQQIFGLSRQQTLAYVRRGRLILRERRTLCTHY
jgi:hypothetical protein